eukprot:CAMPEP_0177655746 /NCGR_PEP_ID=MMETSP0447-20121125/15152_1 /TAXON_ID=0 /ORGANISM="Stygamoeba regulata, Strain BSH-02190019" /LENGTH=609 /DNA_ID=CAMNT_0019159727 /DNA_START=51 /DNA_END=1880 /DNA_ORIENTATION=+
MQLSRSLLTRLPSFSRVGLRGAPASTLAGLVGPATHMPARSVQHDRRVMSSAAQPAMFCFQCQQTEGNKGCTTVGNCGKTADVAALQDLLVHALKGVAMYAHRAAKLGQQSDAIDGFLCDALFTTLTNVNFDPARFAEFLKQCEQKRQEAKALYAQACKQAGVAQEDLSQNMYASWSYNEKMDMDTLVNKGRSVGVLARQAAADPNVFSMTEMITYGMKGACAYADHAHTLGADIRGVSAQFYEILDVLTHERPSMELLLATALRVGAVNLQVMGLLETCALARYGDPTPTQVRTTPVAGKCILVSGHDLADVELVLQQTAGKGINVYTHGELLPAHAYPGLKKYPHLVGNYGGAWQHQKSEFAEFPGSILMTTNCIIEPRRSYKDRIFTRSAVGWPGVRHLAGDDLAPLIDAALECEGFEEDEAPKYVTTGFGKNAILANADKVLAAVQQGAVKRIFLIGGCDGAQGERSYFTDVATGLPQDTLILTLACGKYRFNKLDLGSIGPFPRVLDMGQCNDAYGAIQVAVALANALKTDVNSLPLSFVVSWFEQKAVAVLLTLLHLGIKNIRLGPTLPAFVTPDVLNVLVDKYDIKPIGDAQEDIKLMMEGK